MSLSEASSGTGWTLHLRSAYTEYRRAPGVCTNPFSSLITSDYVSPSDSNLIIKFAVGTAVAGLIRGADESDYRHKVDELVTWYNENNLELNASKTGEIVVDFRKKNIPISPLIKDGSEVEQVDSFNFLGIHVSSDLN